MTAYFIVGFVIGICGALVGFLVGVEEVSKRASDGVCIRADDGEAYLRISEEGQKKLMDPSTRILYIRVIDVATRNKHPL